MANKVQADQTRRMPNKMKEAVFMFPYIVIAF